MFSLWVPSKDDRWRCGIRLASAGCRICEKVCVPPEVDAQISEHPSERRQTVLLDDADFRGRISIENKNRGVCMIFRAEGGLQLEKSQVSIELPKFGSK